MHNRRKGCVAGIVATRLSWARTRTTRTTSASSLNIVNLCPIMYTRLRQLLYSKLKTTRIVCPNKLITGSSLLCTARNETETEQSRGKFDTT